MTRTEYLDQFSDCESQRAMLGHAWDAAIDEAAAICEAVTVEYLSCSAGVVLQVWLSETCRERSLALKESK